MRNTIKFKITKNQKKILFKVFFVFFIIFSVAYIIHSNYTFWVGWHNIDLGRNIDIFNCEEDTNYIDINNFNETWTGTEMYMTGLSQIQQGFYNGLAGVLLLGIAISGLTLF